MSKLDEEISAPIYQMFNGPDRKFAPDMPVGWPRPVSLLDFHKKRDAAFIDKISRALAELMIEAHPSVVDRALKIMSPDWHARRHEIATMIECARRARFSDPRNFHSRERKRR